MQRPAPACSGCIIAFPPVSLSHVSCQCSVSTFKRANVVKCFPAPSPEVLANDFLFCSSGFPSNGINGKGESSKRGEKKSNPCRCSTQLVQKRDRQCLPSRHSGRPVTDQGRAGKSRWGGKGKRDG